MSRTQRSDHTLVTVLDAGSEAAEAFRIIRTNLRFSHPDTPLKTVLITSPGRSEGKTLSTANLAVALAGDGARVLAVDANLRWPGLSAVFGLEESPVGLSSVLQGTHALEHVVKAGPVERLSVLPSGPVAATPAELLGSERMTAFLAAAREAFDLVLIDSPPALGVSDAVVLAPKVDGTVLVLRSGMTPYPRAQQARDALRGVRANILGVLLLSVTPGGDGL
jgi:capsular exopolysaccharide synthesis family protein